MATIDYNGKNNYEYLYLAVDDVSAQGTIVVTNGPYVFHSIQEGFEVDGKNVTVSMVASGGGNTLEADHSIVSITGDNSSTGSMRFELGNQIKFKGSSAGFVVDRASATVLRYFIPKDSTVELAVLSFEMDSPQFTLRDASLTIGMGAGQQRDHFLVDTGVYRYVTDTGALQLADGTISEMTSSTLMTDYLYQGSTNRIDVKSNSRIDITGGGIGSISANTSVYYRYADGDNDHSGYYAWQTKWGETVYTNTLEVRTGKTHCYTFDGNTPIDHGVISDCALPNTFENVASKGGIVLNDSTMTADVVRNMSVVSGNLGGIVLNNSTLTVASFIENSGTINVSNGSTVNVAGSVFNDNASIAVSGSTFSASAVSVELGSTFTVAGTSELHIGDLSGTIETDSEALTTLNIRSLDGTIRTANGAKLTGSSINGGGTNGGTITALGNLKFLPTSVLKNITLNATARP